MWIFVLISLPSGRETVFFYLMRVDVRSDDFSVRGGDSGMNSPEVHRPQGRVIGPGWGIDKGDELSYALERRTGV